jgi:hypothetical protein
MLTVVGAVALAALCVAAAWRIGVLGRKRGR